MTKMTKDEIVARIKELQNGSNLRNSNNTTIKDVLKNSVEVAEKFTNWINELLTKSENELLDLFFNNPKYKNNGISQQTQKIEKTIMKIVITEKLKQSKKQSVKVEEPTN